MLDQLIPTLVASVVIMLASLIGVVTVWKKLRHLTEKNLKYLVSFAAGVFLVVAFNLVKESLELTADFPTAIIAFLAGILISHLVAKFFPESHHHHGSGEAEHTHSKNGARRIMFSDGLHNIADGFLLAPAFVIDFHLGIITAAGIWVHEAAQEISEFFVLREAGYSFSEALKLNFLVSGTILIGALAGIFLVSATPFVGPLLGIAGGAFLYTVLRDLIPRSIYDAQAKKTALKHIIAGILGVLVIATVSMLASDNHDHDTDIHQETDYIAHHYKINS